MDSKVSSDYDQQSDPTKDLSSQTQTPISIRNLSSKCKAKQRVKRQRNSSGEQTEPEEKPFQKIGNKRKWSSKKQGSQRARSRNFTSDETCLIIRETSKSIRLLKGRFGPGVTNHIKEERWKEITDMVNGINGCNDRTWDAIRKKFQDVESSARTKARAQERERKKTGGGQSTAPILTKVEEAVLESIPRTVIVGLQCGFDSNTSQSSRVSSHTISLSTPISHILRQSTNVLLDQDTDSEISFNTLPTDDNILDDNLQTGSTTSTMSPLPQHDSLPTTHFNLDEEDQQTSIDQDTQQADTTTNGSTQNSPSSSGAGTSTVQPPQSLEADQAGASGSTDNMSTPLRAGTSAAQDTPRLPSISSNRTVTRDLRRSEFKELLKRHDVTNIHLKQIVELMLMGLKMKYPETNFSI